jgi:hypothetical protein
MHVKTFESSVLGIRKKTSRKQTLKTCPECGLKAGNRQLECSGEGCTHVYRQPKPYKPKPYKYKKRRVQEEHQYPAYVREVTDLEPDGSKSINFAKALHAAHENATNELAGKCGADGMQMKVMEAIENSQSEYYPGEKYIWDPLMPTHGRMTVRQLLELKTKIQKRYLDELKNKEISFCCEGETLHGMPLRSLNRARCANAATALCRSGRPTLVGDFEQWKMPDGKYMVDGLNGHVYRQHGNEYRRLNETVCWNFYHSRGQDKSGYYHYFLFMADIVAIVGAGCFAASAVYFARKVYMEDPNVAEETGGVEISSNTETDYIQLLDHS